jgi:dienelactone hydrolase
MTYDPFARGPHPVGVRTSGLVDTERDRPLTVEVWYPADAAHTGADLSDATKDRYEMFPGLPESTQDAVRDARPIEGRFPLVVFSHGFGGHRRQSTFLCTHLASHGYVVAAMDHTGNTVLDILQMTLAMRSGVEVPEPLGILDAMIAARPRDASFVIDRVLDGSAGDVATLVDADRIGMAGHSFGGGWTTLQTTCVDRRIRAALPLAPAGGATHMPAEPLREALDFAWGREVPTLFLAADKDSLLPLGGMHELLGKTPSSSKRMVVLGNSDHLHFCDNVEQVHEMFRKMPPPGAFEDAAKAVPPIHELFPGAHANDMVRGLGLAHMDAALKANEAAAQLLRGDLKALLAARGVDVS